MQSVPSNDLGEIIAPEGLSQTAREAWDEFIRANPAVRGVDLIGLEQACLMLSEADAISDVIAQYGRVSRNKLGELGIASYVQEQRFLRTAAVQMIQRITPPAEGGESTYQKRARAGAQGGRTSRKVN